MQVTKKNVLVPFIFCNSYTDKWVIEVNSRNLFFFYKVLTKIIGENKFNVFLKIYQYYTPFLYLLYNIIYAQ
jgi:hypothetical protein